jgi:hypothetical protein
MPLIHHFDEMTPEKRPQDPLRNGTGLTFKPAEHGGKCPDTMPQAIVLSDAKAVPRPTIPKRSRPRTARRIGSGPARA